MVIDCNICININHYVIHFELFMFLLVASASGIPVVLDIVT